MQRYSSITCVIQAICLALCCVVIPAIADTGVMVRAESLRQSGLAESAQVGRVQAYFNAVRRVTDKRIWGRSDYWATPSELLRKGGGDCEDIAAAKYFALRELGVPSARMRLVYGRTFDVKSRRIEPHVVLWYRFAPGSDWQVLDSLHNDIQGLSSRTDLLPLLTFNEDMVARWSDSGVEQILGGAELMQSWNGLLKRQQALDIVALVLVIHDL